MPVDSYDKLFEKRISGLLLISLVIIVASYERIGIYIFYRFFSIKIHDRKLQNFLSYATLFIGSILLFWAWFRIWLEEPLFINIIGSVIFICSFVFLRKMHKKFDFLIFYLDDNFYLDKEGNDIRLKKQEP